MQVCTWLQTHSFSVEVKSLDVSYAEVEYVGEVFDYRRDLLNLGPTCFKLCCDGVAPSYVTADLSTSTTNLLAKQRCCRGMATTGGRGMATTGGVA